MALHNIVSLASVEGIVCVVADERQPGGFFRQADEIVGVKLVLADAFESDRRGA